MEADCEVVPIATYSVLAVNVDTAAESDAFMASGQPPENRQAFITQAEHTTPEFSGWFAEWNELSGTLLNPILAEIWAGTADPAEVLPQLCADVDAYLADAGYPK